MNHYQTLGVGHNADLREIKKAYRKKSQELHPDKNPDPLARPEYDRVRQAYDCLSDTTKRELYDLSLQRKNNPYEEMKSFFYRAEKAKAAKQSKSFSAKITLEEAFCGCKRFVPSANKYIQIPAGVTHGAKLKADDLTIMVYIAAHNKYKVDKNNLYTTLYIDAIQAMVGIDLYINHPNGEKLKAKILPGTQEGQKLRIAGKGLHSKIHGNGDLIIICHIVIPELTKDERDSIINLLNSSSAEI